ncbi:uncharacterized protein LOC126789203 isoform X2 [Argentina anserina]|uniref:uncharacterized protein LOC126789203 isoform X2 n=1 Tax=Argentina anserina TaxID=57926 RepID=UPI0021762E19|nr:uncharacterized protein LOC126789203 isoform X2 [Potentilla anserina]
MSKKKVSGNTMTLKDFHGGSIPSDLPLPSAPGVVVRPTDRQGYDRPATWGNPMGRPDHRSRPHTSPATRHFDDKTPFLAHSVHIGRNFDEDERKPLDGVSAPRRTISEDSVRAVPACTKAKQPVFSSPGGVSGVQGWGAAPLSPRGGGSSYSERVSEAAQSGSGNGGRGGGGGAQPNAWVVRKEMAGVTEPVQAVWSGQSAVVKLAHASALEKVSSGRWQSKPSIEYQANSMEVARSVETESGVHSRGYGSDGRMDVIVERQNYDPSLARQMERGLKIDDGIQNARKELPDYERARGPIISEVLKERNPVVRKELPDYERGRAPMVSDVRERKPIVYSNRAQPAQSDDRYVQPEVQPFASSEPVERPKLKLLPRTRPVEHLEDPVGDQTQEYQQPVYVETVNEAYGNMNYTKPGSAGSETGKLAVERPKLNLKPRSQPLEQLEVIAERERNALFGGARPRELVLKARGVDDVVINNSDLVQHSEKVENHVSRADHHVLRAEHHSPKLDRGPGHVNPTRHPDKADNQSFDQRTGNKFDRRDNQVERVDLQKRNWRNDGRKNNRETDRQQPQQSERPPSPETWRKPELPKPSSPDGASLHRGKAASALELAQAFSRSVSDPKLNDRISNQRGIPTRGQVPFSRLMGPTPRPQINGY